MLKGIVVVESPAKAKILGAYLGSDYKVVASYGHVRDLVPKDGAINPDDHYAMLWEFNDRGRKQIKEITDLVKQADTLFLATDPDREGEAISWHIIEALKAKKVLANKDIKRVVFHEITKTAVKHAFDHPKILDQSLVDAYLARRALDYLVGFSLSPILWRKMPGAKSAGRVQSVALRLIVERELEIQRFKSEEYWSIHANFTAQKGDFTATLTHFDNTKLEKLDIKNEAYATDIKRQLESKQYFIDKIEKKAVKRNPYAPFTTSTLQQEAVRKLRFSAKKTMQIAQKLYEGASIDGAMVGLITYMRTDSTVLSKEALDGARNLIKDEYGDRYLPDAPRVYKTKTKNAQEAHEAIRPTSFSRNPESIKQFIAGDEYTLYDLIWKRTVASQMENAIFDQVSADILPNDRTAIFKASGSTISFDGFLKVYVESTDDDSDDVDKKQKKLPTLIEGEKLNLNEITNAQHFTQPPPRFNEASLVKKLEELGIGRPSTYAMIINVLQVRKYVSMQKRAFVPDSIGFLVISFLKSFFAKYVEYGFTASLEEELDDISNGTLIWEKVLDSFWSEFNKQITNASERTITEVITKVEEDLSDYVFSGVDKDRVCPLCKVGKINLKFGRFGAFLGCSDYPGCKFTKKLGTDMTNENPENPSNNPLKVEIGRDTSRNDDTVFLKNGPFGYYFEWDKTKDTSDPKKTKPKRQSIPRFIFDPTELTIDDAMILSNLPKLLGIHPKSKKEIQLILGRFGPYLKMGDKSYKLEKDVGFIRLTLHDAIEIIDRS
ncbi:MAG: type I DNA topoisomerase [Holosporales bacterium]|jgi:DNA topoisomerase-1|nr:type I DNA topoisomerase [Holosporales bacterium]